MLYWILEETLFFALRPLPAHSGGPFWAMKGCLRAVGGVCIYTGPPQEEQTYLLRLRRALKLTSGCLGSCDTDLTCKPENQSAQLREFLLLWTRGRFGVREIKIKRQTGGPNLLVCLFQKITYIDLD